MLAPVLGRNHRVRDELLGEFDSVVGKPLGAQSPDGWDDHIRQWRETAARSTRLGDPRRHQIRISCETEPRRSLGHDGQQTRKSSRIVLRSDLRCKPLHHRIPVVLSVLGPDAESEVQAALTSPLGNANQHIQMPGALLCGKTDGTDLGEFGDFQQKGIRWRQVGDLVAEGETQVVVTAARQPTPSTRPKTPQRRTKPLRDDGCRETVAYCAKPSAAIGSQKQLPHKRRLPVQPIRRHAPLRARAYIRPRSSLPQMRNPPAARGWRTKDSGASGQRTPARVRASSTADDWAARPMMKSESDPDTAATSTDTPRVPRARVSSSNAQRAARGSSISTTRFIR